MSTTQMSESNAMSEYEFPDISDDNSIEQEETSYVNKIALSFTDYY